MLGSKLVRVSLAVHSSIFSDMNFVANQPLKFSNIINTSLININKLHYVYSLNSL